MKYIDEYRDEADTLILLHEIGRTVTRPWTVMEICGGQTHTFVREGIDKMLPGNVTLVHGPGCPVCVTPLEMIDRAVEIAGKPGVILASFGDMLRVPGTCSDLLGIKASGGDVRIVYSPLDAVKLAMTHPDREVVFLAVGFETTAPASATAVWQAKENGLENFSVLCAHVLVPPAIEAILRAPGNRVEGFLAAGHVCTIMGLEEYEPIAEKYRMPIVVAGFEALDLLQALLMVCRALEEGRYGVENQYARAVRREGNPAARSMMRQVFDVCDRPWRGIGTIPRSGLCLKTEYARYDAAERFDVAAVSNMDPPECIAGRILQGLGKPGDCPQFGTGCTPEHPLGAPMVSSEGTCAAYFRYGRNA